MTKVIFNGNIIDEKDANVSILDKGYFFDYAVYSSIKVIQGKIFFGKDHVDRLFESARLINIDHRFSKAEVLKWLDKLVEINKFKDALLRIVLIGDPEQSSNAKLFIFSLGGLTFYPDKLYKTGAKVITYPGERRIPNSKSKDLLFNFLALTKAKEENAIDALLVDDDGNIREGTRSNFFAIKNQILITPPANKVLEGIAKKIVLKTVNGILEVKTEDIPLKRIRNYDEFFLTSTSINVMPIRQIDEIVIETKFEKTQKIMSLFKDYSRRKQPNLI